MTFWLFTSSVLSPVPRMLFAGAESHAGWTAPKKPEAVKAFTAQPANDLGPATDEE